VVHNFQTIHDYNEDLDALRAELRAALEACKAAKAAALEAARKAADPRGYLLGPDAIIMLPPGWMMSIELGQGMNEFIVEDGVRKHRSKRSSNKARVGVVTGGGGF